jgi:hypothetical protein
MLLNNLRELNSLQHLSINIRPKQRLPGAAIGGAASGSSSTDGLFPVLEAIAGSGQHLTFLELQGMQHLQLLPQQPAPQEQGVLQQQLGGQDGALEQQQQQEQYLAQFTSLQELTLELPNSRCLGGIEQINSLTKVSLLAQRDIYVLQASPLLSPGDSSSIGCLTRLRSLSLQGGRCSAGAVSNITSLTSLTLNGNQWDAALWGWLERLPLLVSLSFAARVAGGGGDAAMAMVAGGGEDAAVYAALTASSSLQQLDLSEALLPKGVWQHVFLAGRQLQQLHSLCLPSCLHNHLQADDVRALVRCCGSSLRHLDGGQVLPFTPALTSLTQLTYLAVVQARRAADAAHLGSMTHLQQYKVTSDSQHKLKWRCCDIQPLKKLSLLTSLELAGGTLSSDADPVHYLYELRGLAELTVPALTEDQLSRLAVLMRGLTSLSFSTSELGALLIDRLALLDPHSFDLQERALDHPFVNSNVQPSWRLRAGIKRITNISKVCSSSITQIRFGLGHAGQWEALHMNRHARMHDAHSKDRPAGAQCCMGFEGAGGGAVCMSHIVQEVVVKFRQGYPSSQQPVPAYIGHALLF